MLNNNKIIILDVYFNADSAGYSNKGFYLSMLNHTQISTSIKYEGVNIKKLIKQFDV